MTKLFKGLWCRLQAKLVLKNSNVLSKPLGGTDLCSLNFKLIEKIFFQLFFSILPCVRFFSSEETFKLFIIFYFRLINTDMTDVVLEYTVRNYKKNNIFFPSGVYNETIQISLTWQWIGLYCSLRWWVFWWKCRKREEASCKCEWKSQKHLMQMICILKKQHACKRKRYLMYVSRDWKSRQVSVDTFSHNCKIWSMSGWGQHKHCAVLC